MKEIQNKLKTQDNYATKYPLYCVYREYKEYGYDEMFTDNYDWMYPPDEPTAVEDKEIIDILENNEEGEKVIIRKGQEDEEEIDTSKYFKSYYQIKKEFITLFLTEEAAKDFIKNNKHRYCRREGTLVMYVDSAHRNNELIHIIDAIKNGKFTE